MNPDSPVQHVKLRIRLRPGDDVPLGEWLWATPLDANEGGGTYELGNCAFFTPMAAGDIVRAERDADGCLQVVDVVEPSDGILTGVQVADGLGELAKEAGDAWRDHGAIWSEGGDGLLMTIWKAGVGWDEIEEAVAPYVARGLVWLGGAEPGQRGRDCHPDVDFELDRTRREPDVETSYWVGDDPYWREHGLDDPDLLAYVQTMATSDVTVARALEVGDHQWVLDELGLGPDE